jgi:hypothetical protein
MGRGVGDDDAPGFGRQECCNSAEKLSAGGMADQIIVLDIRCCTRPIRNVDGDVDRPILGGRTTPLRLKAIDGQLRRVLRPRKASSDSITTRADPGIGGIASAAANKLKGISWELCVDPHAYLERAGVSVAERAGVILAQLEHQDGVVPPTQLAAPQGVHRTTLRKLSEDKPPSAVILAEGAPDTKQTACAARRRDVGVPSQQLAKKRRRRIAISILTPRGKPVEGVGQACFANYGGGFVFP